MRKLSILLALSIAVAAVICVAAKPEPYGERLTRVAARDALPQMADALAREPTTVNAVFLHYADDPALVLNARLALMRYPDMTRRILPLYGADPAFQQVLLAYGPSVMPPIDYFLDNDVGTLKAMKLAAETAQAAHRLWDGDAAPGDGRNSDNGLSLSPAERGRYAIGFIGKEGHDFLGQFVVDPGGKVHWIQSERVLQNLNAFFAGGIRTLETRYRKDEDLRPRDYLWAGVDVLATAATLKALRIARTGSATAGLGAESVEAAGTGARTAETASFASRTAAVLPDLVRAGGLGGRIAKYGAVAAAAYLAFRHPSLITGIAGKAAHIMGLPTWIVQFVVWTVILLPALYIGVFLIRFALRPLLRLLGALGTALSWLDRRGRRPAEEP